ncbi:hypothetical protein MKP08_04715 [Erythrobacter sp. LQ02-29]|uniref:hypothetical protein n=1 Tax=unclassified Erythrobacter TaxID=2633097 RepID=UPI001BFC9687|nr:MULTISPECIES: hypothetical protein [unclassified Erythrobacter]MCP9222049.1 hypothetical protein [Erythrobacter sp. LQ02-29]
MAIQWNDRWRWERRVVKTKLRCLLGKHEPDRMRVFVESDGFFGICRACGANIVRRDRNDWVSDPMGRAGILAESRKG